MSRDSIDGAPRRRRGRGERTDDSGELTHAVIGAAIEVHRQLGPGLLESVYESALCRELFLRRLQVRRQVKLPVWYKGVEVGCGLRLDLVVADRLIVEVMAVERLGQIHRSHR